MFCENMGVFLLEQFFHNNFLIIWTEFLAFETQRSRMLSEFFGTTNTYLIMQIICWHHLLILKKTDSNIAAETFFNRDIVESMWLKFSKKNYNNKSVLTYSLISVLSGLSIETIRRHVAILTKNKWVKYTIKKGVTYSPSEENNRQLAEVINIKENKMLIDFLKLLEKLKKSDENFIKNV